MWGASLLHNVELSGGQYFCIIPVSCKFRPLLRRVRLQSQDIVFLRGYVRRWSLAASMSRVRSQKSISGVVRVALRNAPYKLGDRCFRDGLYRISTKD